ncbi:DUF2189 domain-containing protein [Lutibaculum baratangense]|uniref:DUF2189 domain-containing protein n=1 Tax=Lutibaculum baratangense AMV1 TaxID=631454 RepID=V4QTX5_9HYPH|nr:DUF2189 domain-containing protein [Lutibaculum baratangense]ESR23232.1 hypothetical protein N177_3300 [Lutibaculum baratangense AMV1]
MTEDAIRGVAASKMRKGDPAIASIGVAEVGAVLVLGMRDLRRAPVLGAAIGLLFVAGGWFIYALVALADLLFLAYPLAAGFTLLGPFAAIALYDVSRRLETVDRLSWREVLGTVLGPGARSLGWMPMLNLFVFIIWIDVAAALFLSFFGLTRMEAGEFLSELFTTTHGLLFLALGNAVGAIFAVGVYASTVLAYPMLLDRDTNFVTAIATSWRAVRANPVPMLLYGVLVAVLTFLAILPALLGLILALPLFGHTSWHLYRRVVRWEEPGEVRAEGVDTAHRAA